MKTERISKMVSIFFFVTKHDGQEIPYQIRITREKDCDKCHLVFGHEETPQPWPQGVGDFTLSFDPSGYPAVYIRKMDGTQLVKWCGTFGLIPGAGHEHWQKLSVEINFEPDAGRAAPRSD